MSARLILILYTAVIVTIFVSAYLGIIPTTLKSIPYYDSIGHFILYGIWGFCFGRVFTKATVSFGKLIIPLGIVIAFAIAIIEESLQNLSPIRTFSLSDLGCGLLGITAACLLLQFKKPNES
ncbi:MAG TPA: VanZ family protein [Flavobacterium sp.]|nr:VanZ family protein [Flavobacterium sp.]